MTPMAMMTCARAVTVEPGPVEPHASVNACDEAAAATCDNAAAVKFMDADAAADAVSADRPRIPYEDVVCDTGNAVNAPSRKTADGVRVEIAEYGFAVVERLDCPLCPFLKMVKNMVLLTSIQSQY